MSQPSPEPQSQQSIEDSSLSKSQVAQAGRDVHQTYQEVHHHWGDRPSDALRKPARKGVEKILLQQVKGEIKARLATSLHSATFINLDKEKQTGYVQRGWDADVKIGHQQSISLDADTRIIDVFDQDNVLGKLLILGSPGAGKTTTLLELAEILVQRAEEHLDAPMPVVLNLASWKSNQSLDHWLTKELKSKYGVREAIAKTWLTHYQLLPLFDGLDEVNSQWHEACIQALNQFYETYRPEHLVVCCRLSDYENSPTKLQLNAAIYLNPLSESQIHDYLMSAEHPELWESIEADPALMKLAQSPLLLSILALSRQEISIEDWQNLSTGTEQRHYLVKVYVDRMLSRPISQRWYASGQSPTRQQTQRWLSKLAKQLKTNAQSEFLIERIQPDWLDTPKQKQLYRLAAGLIMGAVLGIIIGFSDRVVEGLIAYVSEGLAMSLPTGLFFGVVTAAFGGIAFGLVGLLTFGLSNRPFKQFIYGPVIGMVAGGPIEVWEGGQFHDGLIGGLIVGLFFAIIATAILQRPIRSLETLSWSISKAKSGAWYGFASGAALVVIVALSEELEPRIGLFFAILLGGIVLGGCIGGLQNVINPITVGRLSLQKIPRGGLYGCIGGLALGLLWNAFFSFQVISNPSMFSSFFVFEHAGVIWNLLVFVIYYEFVAGLGGAILGSVIAACIGLFLGIWQETRQRRMDETRTRWSLHGSLKGVIFGGLGGAIVGILALSPYLGPHPWVRLVFSPLYASFLGFFGSLIGAVVGGCRGPDIEIRTFPNQGMWQSAVNSIIAALVAGVVLGVMSILPSWLSGNAAAALNGGLMSSILIGLFCGIALGGASIRHVALRFTLYRHGLAPWNYARFLNYASERMLIQRIGGRYQFIHDVFRQYFANF